MGLGESGGLSQAAAENSGPQVHLADHGLHIDETQVITGRGQAPWLLCHFGHNERAGQGIVPIPGGIPQDARSIVQILGDLRRNSLRKGSD